MKRRTALDHVAPIWTVPPCQPGIDVSLMLILVISPEMASNKDLHIALAIHGPLLVALGVRATQSGTAYELGSNVAAGWPRGSKTPHIFAVAASGTS